MRQRINTGFLMKSVKIVFYLQKTEHINIIIIYTFRRNKYLLVPQ